MRTTTLAFLLFILAPTMAIVALVEGYYLAALICAIYTPAFYVFWRIWRQEDERMFMRDVGRHNRTERKKT